jgi:NitT/TauT family transport system ATP-binding protein
MPEHGAEADTDPRSDRVAAAGVEALRGPALALDAVTKRYGDVVALSGVSLDVAPGAFVAVVGPSGCGKTTLLRIAGGLEPPSEGQVALADPRGVSFCFQEARLLPWRSALENVALPLELAGIPAAERRARAAAALGAVQLGDRAAALPAELSGGMRMRVALARAIATGPRLLLLDEPFGALDEVTREELDEVLRAVWRSTGATALLVTHSIAEAAYLADAVVVLSRSPGRVVARRTTALPVRGPGARATRAFQEEVAALHRALAASAGRPGG